jgi:hypothetical protein
LRCAANDGNAGHDDADNQDATQNSANFAENDKNPIWGGGGHLGFAFYDSSDSSGKLHLLLPT